MFSPCAFTWKKFPPNVPGNLFGSRRLGEIAELKFEEDFDDNNLPIDSSPRLMFTFLASSDEADD